MDTCGGNMKNNYSVVYNKLALPSDILLCSEGDFIYFISSSLVNGSALLEEWNNSIIVWDYSLLLVPASVFYKALINEFETTLYFPYVEGEKEVQELIGLGALKIDFNYSFCKEYANSLGSYFLNKENLK